jgi:hypothetical protein
MVPVIAAKAPKAIAETGQMIQVKSQSPVMKLHAR